jgi:hypothetical protein
MSVSPGVKEDQGHRWCQFIDHLVRGRGPGRPTYSVPNHLIEHDAVKRSEQSPISEAWDPARAKDRDLLKQTLVDAVTQPGISGKPLLAAQHDVSIVYLLDSPPVDQRVGDQCLRTLWAKSLTHKAPED